MHPTTKAMWNSDTLLKDWAKKHGFNDQYVTAVIVGRKGEHDMGIAKQIRDALKAQGYWRDAKLVDGRWVEVKPKLKRAA